MSAFVLVHGGVHTAACWDLAKQALEARGHTVEAIDLPGRGATAEQASSATLEDWVAAVKQAIERAPEQPIVVGHSMGGVSTTQLADREPGLFKRLVYVAAIVPQSGEAALPKLQEAGPDCVLLREGAIVPAPDGTTATVPRDFAREAFYNRTDPAVAEVALDGLVAEPLAPLATPLQLDSGGLSQIDRLYIGTAFDQAVPPAFQQQLAAVAGVPYEQLQSDHSPFVSDVENFLALLVR